MSTFKGSLGSKRQEHHSFISQDKFLVNINMNSFTLRSCQNLYKQNRKLLKNNSLFDPMPETIEEEQTILDLSPNVTCEYTTFNNGTLQYNAFPTSINYDTLKIIIKYHESLIFNRSTQQIIPQYDNIIKDIKNSLEKSVVCKFDMFGFAASDTQNYPDGKFKINLTFQDRGNRSNERSVAFQNIQVAAPPKTPTGETYSFRQSDDFQKSATNNINSILPGANSSLDSKASQSEKSNTFGQDAVAGQLDIWYDNNTGKWKSGTTQVLARLTTDIAPAPLEAIGDILLTSTPINDLLKKTTQFATGSGILLSMQNGNPYTLGPTFKECVEKRVIEVKVINRSRKSFKKDETVVLTEINGEWIPQPFGEDQALTSPLKFGDWSFIKLIANTDSYFMDDRFYETGNQQFAGNIKPEDYQKAARYNFYTNILTTWSNLKSFTSDGIKRPALTEIYEGDLLRQIQELNLKNIQPTSFIPSKRYYVCSIFDQLSEDIGGFQQQTILTSTNVEAQSTFVQDDFKYAEEIPLFWGPVYVDGVNKIIPNPKTTPPQIRTSNLYKYKENYVALAPDFPAFDNLNEQLLHVPAECVSKFINPYSAFTMWDSLGKLGFIIYTPHIQGPFYDTSSPKSKNKIQFSPLQAEFAGGDDGMSKFVNNEANSITRNFYDIVRRLINKRTGLGTILPTNFSNYLMGNTYERSASLGYLEANQFISLSDLNDTTLPNCGSIYDISKFNEAPAIKTIRYQCYVKQQPFDTGSVGAPRLFREGFSSSSIGGHCVGIISAKNTISKSGGGKINYSLVQDFGLNQQRTATAGQVSFSTIMGVAFGGSSGGIQTGIPQWGSSTDAIDSFGTTAMHVKIYDYWPEEQTLFDPRYFAVLHFNAGSYYGGTTTLAIIDGETPQQTADRIKNAKNLDIPIPTFVSDQLLPNGVQINKDTNLKPKKDWFLNPIRRGALLTGGGFIYKYQVIGISNNVEIISGGSGFTSSFEYNNSSRNLKIKILVGGGKITGILFEKDALGNEMRGDDFMPNDFNQNFPIYNENGNVIGTDPDKRGFILTFPSQTPGQKQASIAFKTGVSWMKIGKDLEPTQHGPITRLTSSSKRGEGFIEETRDTTLDLGTNSSGKYDCFYHFHNDITHTLILAQPFTAGFAQYVSMTIT